MTHLLDTHAWIQRALGEPIPPLVDQTLTRHAKTLALAGISLWEAAKLVELGRLRLAIPLARRASDRRGRCAVRVPDGPSNPLSPRLAENPRRIERRNQNLTRLRRVWDFEDSSEARLRPNEPFTIRRPVCLEGAGQPRLGTAQGIQSVYGLAGSYL